MIIIYLVGLLHVVRILTLVTDKQTQDSSLRSNSCTSLEKGSHIFLNFPNEPLAVNLILSSLRLSFTHGGCEGGSCNKCNRSNVRGKKRRSAQSVWSKPFTQQFSTSSTFEFTGLKVHSLNLAERGSAWGLCYYGGVSTSTPSGTKDLKQAAQSKQWPSRHRPVWFPRSRPDPMLFLSLQPSAFLLGSWQPLSPAETSHCWLFGLWI